MPNEEKVAFRLPRLITLQTLEPMRNERDRYIYAKDWPNTVEEVEKITQCRFIARWRTSPGATTTRLAQCNAALLIANVSFR